MQQQQDISAKCALPPPPPKKRQPRQSEPLLAHHRLMRSLTKQSLWLMLNQTVLRRPLPLQTHPPRSGVCTARQLLRASMRKLRVSVQVLVTWPAPWLRQTPPLQLLGVRKLGLKQLGEL